MGIGIWTEVALAYAIHKSLIFVRRYAFLRDWRAEGDIVAARRCAGGVVLGVMGGGRG